ncbi:hypothetical protein X797_008226 [Metarhizium robertsii]|uniref:Uncharacterized protein n=2 Tax=Metarhizium robertsii TaxID=568076 RepID=E9F9M4_METRA|nr:uncharacterized protein MAA_08973 [Metarhizium robertsii ARSEF 23]EFY95517.1 hypothetical protein MAA_08973 [Metarhizium robertsii ARSEF 23]EXU98752.1 hypothetical protein X797_008226 [Metarhizium robertsii]
MAYKDLSDEWHWEPMLVAERILHKNKIQYIILGSAAIQQHRIREKDGAPPSSPIPWDLVNTFEIGIPNENIGKAVELLCKDDLFKKQDDENYDTMYEGTRLHTKLRSTWNTFTAVNFILLPTEEYYVAGHPLLPRKKPCTSQFQLPFAGLSGLVLSLLHRKLAHKDHTAGLALDRMNPDHLCPFGLPGIKPPADWDADLCAKATKWLHEHKMLPDQVKNRPVRGIFGDAVRQPEEESPATRDLLGPGPPAVDVGQKRKADAEEDGDGGLFREKRAKNTIRGEV